MTELEGEGGSERRETNAVSLRGSSLCGAYQHSQGVWGRHGSACVSDGAVRKRWKEGMVVEEELHDSASVFYHRSRGD